LITLDKIEEWIREAEERPASAPLIIHYIAKRLSELANRNEELLSENIELRTGRKSEEYEGRIANLEYQLELLKRQLSGEASASAVVSAGEPSQAEGSSSTLIAKTNSLLIYNPQGGVLRVELTASDLISRKPVAGFPGEVAAEDTPPRLLVTSSREELLFVFDSGRTAALPADEVPAAGREGLDWRQAFIQEPRGSEELATILPIARMSLYEFSVQTSRRGFVKKIRQDFFESYIASAYIGTGVKLPSDKPYSLTFCGKDDLLVMVSKEGYLFSVDVNRLPFAAEEAMRLSATDHIVAAFVIAQKPSILIVTQSGKAIHRDVSWLEPVSSFNKTKGQPVFSKERRESGVRVVGAAPVDENDRGLALSGDGKINAYKMGDLFDTGSLLAKPSPTANILGFTAFRMESSGSQVE